jgi:hypothetical protein
VLDAICCQFRDDEFGPLQGVERRLDQDLVHEASGLGNRIGRRRKGPRGGHGSTGRVLGPARGNSPRGRGSISTNRCTHESVLVFGPRAAAARLDPPMTECISPNSRVANIFGCWGRGPYDQLKAWSPTRRRLTPRGATISGALSGNVCWSFPSRPAAGQRESAADPAPSDGVKEPASHDERPDAGRGRPGSCDRS